MSTAPLPSPKTPSQNMPSQNVPSQDAASSELAVDHLDALVSSNPTVSARSKVQPSPAFLRPLFSCGGALGLGLVLAHFLVKPAPNRSAGALGISEVGHLSQVFLPRENTVVVAVQQPPGALLRGRFQLATDSAGTSPVAGAVARQLVDVGAQVQRGDAVLEISSGQAERPAPQAESLQNQAEKQQVDATTSQTALAQKVAAAQAQLLSAQERVTRAQTQIAQARDIVRRLQNGQPVAATEIPLSLRGAVAAPVASAAQNSFEPRATEPRATEPRATKRAPRRRRKRRLPRATASPAASLAAIGPSRAATIALQQAQAAGEAAKAGVRDSRNARQMLGLAQKSAREADDRVKTTAATVSEVEARFDDKKATGADVEAARSAQRDAVSLAAIAAKNVTSALSELSQREKAAASLQQYAEKAQTEAATLSANDSKLAALPQATPTAEQGPDAAPAAPATEATAAPKIAPRSDGRLTLQEAARFAGAALDESRRASRDAERIHTAIETYQNQVTASRTRIESATKNLASAQQKVLDVVPRPRFTAARAPATGIVTWISRLAREVGAGQSVFGLASGAKIGVQFQDKSGLWRALKPGAVLPALLETTPTPSPAPAADKVPSSATPAATTASITSPNSVVSALQGAAQGGAAQVKIASVTAPASPGEAAIVSGQFIGALSEASGLVKRLTVVASVPQPNARPTLSVPVSAILREGDQAYLAVLSAAPPSATSAPAPTSTALVPAPTALEGSAKEKNADFLLRWQPVEVGRSDGLRQEIKVGLSAGARVVLRPLELVALGVSTPDKAPLSAGAGSVVNSAATSSEAGLNPAEIVVHLTDSSAQDHTSVS